MLYGKSNKLVNAVPQRWISTCDVLQTVLSNWSALEVHYSENESVAFPLSASKASIEELYSLVKPIAILIKETQNTNVPTGVQTLLDLVAIRVSLSKEVSPLHIQTPKRHVTAAVEVCTGMAQPVMREHTALQNVTKKTKKLLATAVDKRFFKRYDLDAPGAKPDFLFEMAICMNPFLADLNFLPSIYKSNEMVVCVQAVVRNKIIDLTTKMAEECESSEPTTVKSPRSSSANANDAWPKKKERPSGGQGPSTTPSKAVSKGAVRLFESGMFGNIVRGRALGSAPKTQRQLCAEEFDRFVLAGREGTLETKPVDDMLRYWSSEGSRLYPLMARATRALLSIPASAAVLERDFSTTGRLITGCRNRLDAAQNEMLLFLNGSYDHTPKEVPMPSDAQALAAVPERLSNASESASKLSEGPEEGDDESDVDDFIAEQRGYEEGDGHGAVGWIDSLTTTGMSGMFICLLFVSEIERSWSGLNIPRSWVAAVGVQFRRRLGIYHSRAYVEARGSGESLFPNPAPKSAGFCTINITLPLP
ncbi:unnamed protein product [Sphacelaria rigidula]